MLDVVYDREERTAQSEKLKKVSRVVGLDPRDLVRIGLTRICDEVEFTGELQVAKWLKPVLPRKLHQRALEVDQAFDLAPGHGTVEALVESELELFIEGDFGLIIEGWDLEDPAKAEQLSNAMVARWREEDGLPPIEPFAVKCGLSAGEGRAA